MTDNSRVGITYMLTNREVIVFDIGSGQSC